MDGEDGKKFLSVSVRPVEERAEPKSAAKPAVADNAIPPRGPMADSDIYDSAAEAGADRAPQKAPLSAGTAWDRALRRDDCGD